VGYAQVVSGASAVSREEVAENSADTEVLVKQTISRPYFSHSVVTTTVKMR